MSVLIKGMEMPKNCINCKLTDSEYCTCVLMEFYNDDYEVGKYDKERAPFCPLVEVPPHGRLIDADALKGEIIRTYEYEFPTATGAFDEFATRILPNIINNASTIIEAEEGEKA